jgi:hypothetical protein
MVAAPYRARLMSGVRGTCRVHAAKTNSHGRHPGASARNARAGTRSGRKRGASRGHVGSGIRSYGAGAALIERRQRCGQCAYPDCRTRRAGGRVICRRNARGERRESTQAPEQ